MTAIAHQPHPVTRALAGARDQLHAVSEIPVWSMDAAETTTALHELNALAAQVTELQARVLAHADQSEVAANTGATSTANWHAHTTRTTRIAAHRAMRLAQGLEDHHLTRTALAAGRIHVEQAEAILRALAELPDDLDAPRSRTPNATCSTSPPTTTPKHSSSWAGTSSRSPAPRPPTPTKPSCSNAKNATPQPPPG